MTVSFSGHLVALIRRRNSVSSASEKLTRKGRIASGSSSITVSGLPPAPAGIVLRPRRDVRLGVVSIRYVVFIFCVSFVCCFRLKGHLRWMWHARWPRWAGGRTGVPVPPHPPDG